MRFRTVGFCLVFLSPLFALFLLLMTRSSWTTEISYVTTGMRDTYFNLFLAFFKVSGITIYYIGQQREEMKTKTFPFFYGLSGIFIILGIISVFSAYFFYFGELIPWSRELGVRALTVWDGLRHITWAIDGILWITSGFLFLTF